MHPYKSAFFLLICLLLAFSSCDHCKNLDCITDRYAGQFRVLRQADGKDLVFGPNAVYDKSKFRFYSLKGADTVFYTHQAVYFPSSGYDSILTINFFPLPTGPAYLKWNDLDTDTLDISADTFSTRCCGLITEIKSFRFNNTINIPGDKGTQEIRK